MSNSPTHCESLSSVRTEALFIALTAVFLALFSWRASMGHLGVLTIFFFCFFVVFLFYSLNYRTLTISITSEALRLKFGLFNWTVPLDNVEDCRLDNVPLLKRMGGAGIHFFTVRRRYRVSFNFLEYPRVVIRLKKRAGLVRDVSFSSCRPDEVVRIVREAVEMRSAGG